MASSASENTSNAPSAGARRPLIGVTTYLQQAATGVWDTTAAYLHAAYLDAVVEAGGIPVLLPPQPCDDDQAAQALAAVDALVIAGGADVDPRRYAAAPHPLTGAPREDRDAWEAALLRAALEAGTPFLGICRGLQVLNVELGGTLIQHLPDVVGDDRYQVGAGTFGSEEIEIEPGSLLAAAIGPERRAVPVYHHQAVDRVADGLVVTARCDDGVIEALERPGPGYCLAVQWHPEMETDDRRLLAALVERARARRDASETP